MFLFILKVVMFLIGLVLAAFQIMLWFINKNRDKVIQLRNKVMIVWIGLLLLLLIKVIYFR